MTAHLTPFNYQACKSFQKFPEGKSVVMTGALRFNTNRDSFNLLPAGSHFIQGFGVIEHQED
jgi:hypothetical protein